MEFFNQAIDILKILVMALGAGLVLVPRGKFGQDILVDIVCAIVDFQNMTALLIRTIA